MRNNMKRTRRNPAKYDRYAKIMIGNKFNEDKFLPFIERFMKGYGRKINVSPMNEMDDPCALIEFGHGNDYYLGYDSESRTYFTMVEDYRPSMSYYEPDDSEFVDLTIGRQSMTQACMDIVAHYLKTKHENELESLYNRYEEMIQEENP